MPSGWKRGNFLPSRKLIHPNSLIQIGKFYSSDVLVSDAQNHCVPIREILDVPTHLYNYVTLIVMPFLRRIGGPPFLTIGEAIEFFRQVIEGLQVMHKNNVVHRFVSVRH